MSRIMPSSTLLRLRASLRIFLSFNRVPSPTLSSKDRPYHKHEKKGKGRGGGEGGREFNYFLRVHDVDLGKNRGLHREGRGRNAFFGASEASFPVYDDDQKQNKTGVFFLPFWSRDRILLCVPPDDRKLSPLPHQNKNKKEQTETR